MPLFVQGKPAIAAKKGIARSASAFVIDALGS